MGNLWRSSKSRLVNKIREAPNEEERLKLRPKNIKSEADWKAFVREKTSAEFKVHKSVILFYYKCRVTIVKIRVHGEFLTCRALYQNINKYNEIWKGT